ncbi:hypothetical protein [Acidocella facilis]|uniref:hypothetical protein n=1 Tax=Acidocella facilis TaxID=525 RepID=UPI001F306AE5|nr:hypothetical protein [Acidocella facilis]
MSAYAGQDQRRKALNHFPPHPFLTIRLHTGTLLILPQNHESFDMRRFQIYWEWHPSRGAGAYELEKFIQLDWHIAAQIKDFYNSLLGGGANRLTDQQILDWLRSEVQSTALAAFWLQDEWMLGGAISAPAASLSSPPATLPVAQWTAKHKIEAMFEAIPGHLGPAAREQFNAFLTPQNLAIMVEFLAAGLAIQAIPIADAVADAIIAALAYAMYGWAGLVAGYEFTKAVIQAGRAQSQPDIDHAAQKAADALITLGVLFLAKLVEKVKVDSGKKPKKPTKTEPSNKPARGSTDDIMQRYNRGSDGVTYPRVNNQFTPDSIYDQNNPTADQELAKEQLQDQLDSSGNPAWDDDKIDQVLNSGSNFGTKDYSVGDNIYKLQNLGYNPDTPSPYILDQNGMNQLINQGYVDENLNVTNAAGVKQYLALPCYNMAQTVFQGQVTAPTTGVTSQINSASELFNLDNGAGGVDEGKLLMTGGGSQVSLPPSAVSFGK